LSLLSILNWKSNNTCTLNQKVNGPYFIFPLDHLNEWIRSCLSLWRFNITWSPSFFRMRHWFFTWFHNSAYVFSKTTLCLCLGISQVYLWAKYYNVVLYLLPMFRLQLTLRRLSSSFDHIHSGYTSGISNDRKVHVIYSMIRE